MKWNKHSAFEGQHAFLSASKYSWLNYDDDKLIEAYRSYRAAEKGTEDHAFAALCIKRGQKLPSRPKTTLSMYVNDCIGFRMDPEVLLYYSPFCFGTADAISYRDGILRINDYKSGKIPAKIDQLMVYTALFFLEYDIPPASTKVELRIYQSEDILICNPEVDDILPIMDLIVRYDKLLKEYNKEEE